MSKKLLEEKLFTRRAMLLGACKIGLFAGLFGRMFYLQVINSKEFSELSENNYLKNKVIEPLRGRIFARNQQIIVTNQQEYKLIFTRLELHDKAFLTEIISEIVKILNFSTEQTSVLIKQLNDLNIGQSVIINKNLDWKELVALELHIVDFPGTDIDVDFLRCYPYGELFAHVTGYIRDASEKDNLGLLKNRNLKIGKAGIEKSQDELLRGKEGIKRIEVNARGKIIRELTTSYPVTGDDIHLTLDLNLQKTASDLLGNNPGVVLVAKIDTGEILVSLSKPSYDPNIFGKDISIQSWQNIINNHDLPMLDRTVALTYPPGSGFKINAAVAALKNKFDPNTHFNCHGSYPVGDRMFRCWNRSGHGALNLYQAIEQSCNVYFWNVAKLIGFDQIAEVARSFGYGSKVFNNILPREQSGIMPDSEWKKKNKGTNWTLADTINATIGQGYVEATPIQMLTMVSRIASGKKFLPNLFINNSKANFDHLGYSNELGIVRKAMEMVVNNNHGTAYFNRILEKELAMAGKTGTSQVISKRHSNDDLSGINIMKGIRNHGIFLGYAPLNEPKYSFCSVIEHGGTPALAVKIAKVLLTDAQKNNI